MGKVTTAAGFLAGAAYGRDADAGKVCTGHAGAMEKGQAVVHPTYGISGEYGTWRVTYKVGREGIGQGGCLRVQLPDEWHAGERNSANRLQASDPEDNNYVTVKSSRSDVKLKTIVVSEVSHHLVKHQKASLDGRAGRYVYVVRVQVVRGELKEGDTISVIYGDRRKGSAGYRASAVCTPRPLPVLIAVSPTGDDRRIMLKKPPTITARPGAAVEMLFHLPSQGVVGRTVKALIALVDKENNPVEHSAVVGITNRTIKADFPKKVRIPAGKGYVEFEVTLKETGVLSLYGRAKSFELQTSSNPFRVTDSPPKQNVYWGDIHSHSKFSWDAVGANSFEYARYVSGLDFYALTDHAYWPTPEGLTRGLYDGCYDEYQKFTDRHYEPHRFVTIHGYECSLGTPYGHHNIYFRDRPGRLFYKDKDSLPDIWRALKGAEALTIPHHTGKFPRDIRWSAGGAEFRRNIEIYSGHGLSEARNPEHPLAFERSLFTSDSGSLEGPSYVQDAWIAGLRLSTIASSDDHRSQPGQPRYGLTAIRAPELTREAVFQALYDRRTYATTGAKIVLDFTLDGIPMGQVAKTKSPPALNIQAVGTDVIERVELLRYQPPEKKFAVIRSWRPESYDFAAEHVDHQHKPGAIYYMRLKQKHRIRGRAAMAWSSPIWTKSD
jgi:hypothetical protein